MKKAVFISLVMLFSVNARPVNDRESAIASIKQATKLHAAGKYSAAIKSYDRAARLTPRLREWMNVFAAASASQLGDTAQVRTRLAQVDSLLARDWGWRSMVRAYEKTGARARAVDVAQSATAWGAASRRAAAWYRLSELKRDGGERAGERAALLQAMATAPESDAATDAARRLAELEGLTAEQRLTVGRTLLRAGAVTKGAAQLRRALELGGLSAVSESDARFLVARQTYRSGDKEEGRKGLRELISAHPSSQAAARSLYFLADLAHDEGAIDEAVALYERTIASAAAVDEIPRALMRLGGIAFQQQDYNKALRVFNQYRARYPHGDVHDQATYWAAQSALRLQDSISGRGLLRELRRDSPISYYGMRAAALLGDSLLDARLKTAPSATRTVQKAVAKSLETWQLLRDGELDQAAAFELQRIKDRFANDRAAQYEIAEELNERNASNLAIAIGQDLAGGGWDKRLLRITYPMPYTSLIQREAHTRGLDPFLVAALIRQESRFNRGAVSGAGAIGLMQVMPATGKQLRRKAGVAKVTAQRLKEPVVNVKLGTKFLADLMQMYGGRVDAVLVAYNAGPSRAYRWRDFPEFKMDDLFVERIPFDETREYVKVVLSNAAIYRALYGRSSADD